MDEKDARRSRVSSVPAGTFGGQAPSPPRPAGHDSVPSPFPGAAERRRFVNTLVGEGALADADPEELAALERKRQPNTLVGHPGTPPAAPTLPGVAAPVLAPPKWRGAKAYLEGDEPQPRMSSIPTPSPAPPDRPEGVVIGALRSKVTTKVGPPAHVAAVEVSAEPTSEAIADTIQQMLEGQASVPIQVEEAIEVDALQEITVDELAAIEAASSSEPTSDAPAAQPSPEPQRPEPPAFVAASASNVKSKLSDTAFLTPSDPSASGAELREPRTELPPPKARDERRAESAKAAAEPGVPAADEA
jgi:hypothetical protein